VSTTSDESGEVNSAYFDLQADFGLTKHMGGRGATEELVSLCHLRAGQSILEVGCGVGATTSYLAEEHGCLVTAVDISERMVSRSQARAKRQGVRNRTGFAVADARQLPFAEGCFAALIDESVMAFVQDKQLAMRDYVRVVRPGGYIGLNQVTWSGEPPAELVRYASLIMAGAQFLNSQAWAALLESTGLGEVRLNEYRFSPLSQFVEELRQLDIREYARAWYRFATQSVANPAYREFIKEVMSAPGQILQFARHIGYGIYVGRKPG
jgi:ubiquinone/menaquinone biosynthesis C-methylase UbiE